MPPLSVDPRPYDALLVVSFGGPEKPDDVLPFLENVTRGRGIPTERLREVGEHYHLFGGRSPINDLNRGFVAAVREDFAGAGLDLPVFWGNRNWDPYLADTLGEMRDRGVRRALCFLTSAYSSYSGCRQYRENLADAAAAVGPDAPELDRLRHYYNHPGFVEPMVDASLAALAELEADVRAETRLLFVTHSVPTSMNEASGLSTSPEAVAVDPGSPSGGAYVRQHQQVVDLVTDRLRQHTGHRFGSELVFCSRSGPPSVPWLEPDVGDRIHDLAAEGVRGVVVVLIGFVADHMEVIYDLDVEARAAAEKAGIGFVRAATAGVDPRFVAMVRELVVERAAVERGRTDVLRPAGGELGPSWDRCPVGCCRNPRDPDRPALCGAGGTGGPRGESGVAS